MKISFEPVTVQNNRRIDQPKTSLAHTQSVNMQNNHDQVSFSGKPKVPEGIMTQMKNRIAGIIIPDYKYRRMSQDELLDSLKKNHNKMWKLHGKNSNPKLYKKLNNEYMTAKLYLKDYEIGIINGKFVPTPIKAYLKPETLKIVEKLEKDYPKYDKFIKASMGKAGELTNSNNLDTAKQLLDYLSHRVYINREFSKAFKLDQRAACQELMAKIYDKQGKKLYANFSRLNAAGL